MTKTEIQKALVELQLKTLDLEKQLDKCPDDVEPFACKGKWYLIKNGQVCCGTGESAEMDKHFNYWQTREIAEKAYALQLRQRKMLSFVSQHQELDEGEHYIYRTSCTWRRTTTHNYIPDRVTMTEETADLMLKAIKNGSLILEETK